MSTIYDERMFKCKIHNDQVLICIYTGLNNEPLLRCGKCMLQNGDKYLLVESDFFVETSKFYSYLRNINIDDEKINEINTNLKKEEEIIGKYQIYLDNEKTKVKD